VTAASGSPESVLSACLFPAIADQHRTPLGQCLAAPGHNGPVTAERPAPAHHLLVLPDRDAAEELAAELTELLGLDRQPAPVREALAGDDDAEDAQWLLVLEDPDGRHDAGRLARLAEDYDGWLERS
jgi:hypothetical protein